MTRKSKREIERTLEDLKEESETDDNEPPLVAYEHPVTGDLETRDGEPIDPDDEDCLLLVIEETIVMSRERAEAESREILGPVEDARGGAVEVAPDD